MYVSDDWILRSELLMMVDCKIHRSPDFRLGKDSRELWIDHKNDGGANFEQHGHCPQIGLTFLLGADKSQVTRLEQIGIAGREPNQKNVNWRGITAASLPDQFSMSSDLPIVQSYQGPLTANNLLEELNKKVPKVLFSNRTLPILIFWTAFPRRPHQHSR